MRKAESIRNARVGLSRKKMWPWLALYPGRRTGKPRRKSSVRKTNERDWCGKCENEGYNCEMYSWEAHLARPHGRGHYGGINDCRGDEKGGGKICATSSAILVSRREKHCRAAQLPLEVSSVGSRSAGLSTTESVNQGVIGSRGFVDLEEAEGGKLAP